MYEIFERLMRARGVTAKDVSDATGVNASTLTDWKKGRYTPKDDKRKKIADYFGVSLAYLDGEEERQTDGYYIDPETAAKAQEIFEDPDLRALFDAARDSRPEDLQMATDMLRRFKSTNPDG